MIEVFPKGNKDIFSEVQSFFYRDNPLFLSLQIKIITKKGANWSVVTSNCTVVNQIWSVVTSIWSVVNQIWSVVTSI